MNLGKRIELFLKPLLLTACSIMMKRKNFKTTKTFCSRNTGPDSLARWKRARGSVEQSFRRNLLRSAQPPNHDSSKSSVQGWRWQVGDVSRKIGRNLQKRVQPKRICNWCWKPFYNVSLLWYTLKKISGFRLSDLQQIYIFKIFYHFYSTFLYAKDNNILSAFP